ncbi:MAG: porin family protein, partial [Ramlibacter sp.]
VSPKIFGGYETTPNWGVEGGYIYYAEETGVAWMPGNQLYALKSRGYSSYVAAKYTVPLGERFAAFGKLGVEHSERKTYLAGSRLQTQRDTGLYGGLGVQYALGPKLALTGEYERFGRDKHSGAKADVFTVGLKYGF